MLPAFLVLLGHFKAFRRISVQGICPNCCKKKKPLVTLNTKRSVDAEQGVMENKHIPTMYSRNTHIGTNDYSLMSANDNDVNEGLEDEDAMMEETFWIRLGKFCLRRRFMIVTSTALMLIGTIYVMTRMRPTTDQSLVLSGASPSVQTVRLLESGGFSTGLLAPYYIAVVAQPCSNASLAAGDTCFMLPCNNNDKDLMQFAREFGVSVETCQEVVTNFALINPCVPANRTEEKEHENDKEYNKKGGVRDTRDHLQQIMSNFCPGSCPNYCTANRTTTVMNAELFSTVRRTRVYITIDIIILR